MDIKYTTITKTTLGQTSQSYDVNNNRLGRILPLILIRHKILTITVHLLKILSLEATDRLYK